MRHVGSSTKFDVLDGGKLILVHGSTQPQLQACNVYAIHHSLLFLKCLLLYRVKLLRIFLCVKEHMLFRLVLRVLILLLAYVEATFFF